MQMTIIREDETLTHVALAGAMDVHGVTQIESEFISHTAARGKPVIADLSEVSFIMSSGLTLLSRCAMALKKDGLKMVILHPTERIEETIRTVALHKLIPIAGTLDEAMTLIGQG